MAGDWIKVRKNLLTDPRVVRISSALHADRLRTVGALLSAWCLLDEHTEDGHLAGYTAESFDDIVGVSGLAVAMESVGWLEITTEGVTAPRFTEHNGATARRRAQENVRKMSARMSASDADKKRPREEKRREREDKGNTPLPPSLDTAEFKTVWEEWQQHRREKRQKLTPTAERQQLAKLESLGVDRAVKALRHSLACGYTGIFEPDEKPKPATPTKSKQDLLDEAERIYQQRKAQSDD